MESEDYSFYQGLVFLLENDVKDLGYELTFSTEVNNQSALGNTNMSIFSFWESYCLRVRDPENNFKTFIIALKGKKIISYNSTANTS